MFGLTLQTSYLANNHNSASGVQLSTLNTRVLIISYSDNSVVTTD